MIKVYHNPRCSKSREAIEILESKGKPFEIIKYLENPPTEAELTQLINLLGIEPIELVRTNEPVWKSQYKGKTLSNEQLITAMVNHPKLIERPIVIQDNVAVIGRPPQKILDIL